MLRLFAGKPDRLIKLIHQSFNGTHRINNGLGDLCNKLTILAIHGAKVTKN